MLFQLLIFGIIIVIVLSYLGRGHALLGRIYLYIGGIGTICAALGFAYLAHSSRSDQPIQIDPIILTLWIIGTGLIGFIFVLSGLFCLAKR